jgi:hypothetical protein
VIHLGLLIAAFIIFVLAAVPVPTRVNLIAVGLALFTLSFLFVGR